MMLLLTARVYEAFSIDLRISNAWSARLASLVISIVRAALNRLIGEGADEHAQHRSS
jgi:uncharacterized membrane protein YvlD (DUF360 family)